MFMPLDALSVLVSEEAPLPELSPGRAPPPPIIEECAACIIFFSRVNSTSLSQWNESDYARCEVLDYATRPLSQRDSRMNEPNE